RGDSVPAEEVEDDVPDGASRAARRTRPRRRRAREKDDGEHAKDEDAQRSEQALPADRYREGDAPSREPQAPVRAQAEPAHQAAGWRGDPRPRGHQEDQEVAGEVAQPASRESKKWHA